MSDELSKSGQKEIRQRFLVLHSGQSPADALATVEMDGALMQQAAKKGAIWVKRRKPNGQMAKLKRLRDLHDKVLDGSELFANINPEVLASSVDMPTLLEQHKNYSFWFKPRGVLSQGSKWGDHTAMPELVAGICERTTHLVHRLDRHACGIMVLAHTRPAVKELTALFAKRKVVKQYTVVVPGEWQEKLPYRCEELLDERTAFTEIEAASYSPSEDTSTLEVRLHTGRKHQIRRHLAALNFSVLGDKLYGTKHSDKALALMACELSFDCPFSKQSVRCTVPENFRKSQLLSTLENQ